MGIFDFFRSKKGGDQGADDLMQQMEQMIAEAREKEGTHFEELPQGQGEFGFSPNNPIPFTSIAASREYLENLIYIKPGASEYEWHRSGSMRSDIVSTPVDAYDLIDANNTIVKTVYIWSYNKVNSTKVPEGFGLMG